MTRSNVSSGCAKDGIARRRMKMDNTFFIGSLYSVGMVMFNEIGDTHRRYCHTVNMIVKNHFSHPLKTGYFVKVKNHLKRG